MSDPAAELPSLTASLEEAATRLVGLAQAEAARGRDDVAAELYEVERALNAALRRLRRALHRRT